MGGELWVEVGNNLRRPTHLFVGIFRAANAEERISHLAEVKARRKMSLVWGIYQTGRRGEREGRCSM